MNARDLRALIFLAAFYAILALFVLGQRRALRYRERRRKEREAAVRRIAVAHARLTEIRRLDGVLRRMAAVHARTAEVERELADLAPLARQLAVHDPEPDRAWWSW